MKETAVYCSAKIAETQDRSWTLSRTQPWASQDGEYSQEGLAKALLPREDVLVAAAV